MMFVAAPRLRLPGALGNADDSSAKAAKHHTGSAFRRYIGVANGSEEYFGGKVEPKGAAEREKAQRSRDTSPSRCPRCRSSGNGECRGIHAARSQRGANKPCSMNSSVLHTVSSSELSGRQDPQVKQRRGA